MMSSSSSGVRVSETVRTAIAEKKASDVQKLEELTHEVDALRQNLTQIAAASEIDTLTGAHNRLSFDVALQRMIDRHAISGTRFAVLFCDLDNFKGINDRYGHQIGDRTALLRHFAGKYLQPDSADLCRLKGPCDFDRAVG